MTKALLLWTCVSFSLLTATNAAPVSSASQPILYLIEKGYLPSHIEPVFIADDFALIFADDNPPELPSLSALIPLAAGDYYLLRVRSLNKFKTLPSEIPYILINNTTAIIKTDPAHAEILPLYGWGLTRITPHVKSKKSPPSIGLPVIAQVDSNIAEMISVITPASSRALLNDLCGFYSRYSTTEGCRQAEQYVLDYFLGLDLNGSFFNFTYSGVTMHDVIGEMAGQAAPESIIIVCGHLDNTSEDRYNNAPGAEDNGSGSVVVLEAARALSAYPTDLTVRFVTFSGEEQGLIGSDYYAAYAQRQGEIISAVINVDMVAYSGPYAMDMHIFSDPQSHWLGALGAEILSNYTTLDTISHYQQYPEWGSDHYSFSIRGYPAVFFIDAWQDYDWYPYYHTTADTVGNLNIEQQVSIGQAVAAMAATLARPHFGPGYLPGDANGSDDVNGLDVVFLVNYLKGGPRPDPILSGDSNGDCAANGIDVIYLVNFLKGGPAPFLGDCR